MTLPQMADSRCPVTHAQMLAGPPDQEPPRPAGPDTGLIRHTAPATTAPASMTREAVAFLKELRSEWWYAFPSICSQRLEIGGISYPLAPFTGWYTAAEIGARDLSDATRYNLLPLIASRMGLDTSTDRTPWKDRAMIELTTAVLHSFDAAGVSIIDHHFASRQFVKHEAREQAAGRNTPAHWELIVPPTGGSATPLWERRYQPTITRPNFFDQPPPWEQAES
jgi:nitric oxide synthase oxygenase domain/subunit